MAQCPTCQSNLQPPPVGWHADAHCTRCGGVWISNDRLKEALRLWRITATFKEENPTADFCPQCGPVPLDEGSLLGQAGLSCSGCGGVFMRQPLRYEGHQKQAPSPHSSVKPQAAPPAPSISDRPLSPPTQLRPPAPPPPKPQQEAVPSAPDRSERHPRARREAPPRQASSAQKIRLDQQPPPTIPPVHSQSQPSSSPSQPRMSLGLTLTDLILFGSLIAGIIASLIYWQAP